MPVQKEELLKEITEEVKVVVFQMHSDKAPSPDDMTPDFYQKHWTIVVKDVVKMVKEFFRLGDIITNLKRTSIVLISKKNQSTVVVDLRPIAPCNVLMKVITIVLANRMKILLNMVVSNTQSAFIL